MRDSVETVKDFGAGAGRERDDIHSDILDWHQGGEKNGGDGGERRFTIFTFLQLFETIKSTGAYNTLTI